MILLPAIDLFEGKAVRLVHGDYQQMTVYSDDPVAVARKFEACGAKYVHMVDLEGAKDGTTPNLEIVAAVARETGLFVEIGGGIRSLETVKRYLEAGVSRVILGTAAVTDEAFLKEAVALYGDKIAVGADAKDGYIAVRGWQEKTPLSLDGFLSRLDELGVKNVICTDISKDGAMKGTNRELFRKIAGKYRFDVTASGGVSSLDDIKALKETGIYGAILGKAWYIGAVDLKEALEAVR